MSRFCWNWGTSTRTAKYALQKIQFLGQKQALLLVIFNQCLFSAFFALLRSEANIIFRTNPSFSLFFNPAFRHVVLYLLLPTPFVGQTLILSNKIQRSLSTCCALLAAAAARSQGLSPELSYAPHKTGGLPFGGGGLVLLAVRVSHGLPRNARERVSGTIPSVDYDTMIEQVVRHEHSACAS